MKKWMSLLGTTLLAALFFFPTTQVEAFSWVWHKIGDSGDVQVYIAESSFESNLLEIKTSEEYQVTYWMKVSNGKAEAKSHLQGRINKETQTMYYKVLEGEEIAADGRVTQSEKTDWVLIEPNSAEEYILGEVLKYDLERRVQEIKSQETNEILERESPNNDRRD